MNAKPSKKKSLRQFLRQLVAAWLEFNRYV